ncbi:gamma-glutamylcyclotransferase [Saccharicrinis sp. FJH62]|uniref:gamma-glutamylcyclotransferase family protein n=1 Tax=Saccharicrinis sp. FJH62 TaxID=3344657 RepID=UPI0035D3EC27
MKEEFLFIYGTLIASVNKEMNALVLKYGMPLGEAYMTGRLYEINGYPGFIPTDNQDEKVCGEVYLLKEAIQLFYQLDKYEECSPEFPKPWEYHRLKLPVQLNNGTVIHGCWVYAYNYDAEDLEFIPSGNYRAYLSHK